MTKNIDGENLRFEIPMTSWQDAIKVIAGLHKKREEDLSKILELFAEQEFKQDFFIKVFLGILCRELGVGAEHIKAINEEAQLFVSENWEREKLRRKENRDAEKLINGVFR